MPLEDQPSKPEQIEAAEVERLIARAEQGQLDAADQRRIAPLLRTLVWLQHSLLETRISLAKLKRVLFGKRTEKVPRKPPLDSSDAPLTERDTAGAERPADSGAAPRHPAASAAPAPGRPHGRSRPGRRRRPRIEEADAEMLLAWSERILTAQTLDAIFH